MIKGLGDASIDSLRFIFSNYGGVAYYHSEVGEY